jgi:hypothetical protein
MHAGMPLLASDCPASATMVCLSDCRVWNYAKTPSRGVQELEVYVDEHLVWKVGGSRGGALILSANSVQSCKPRPLCAWAAAGSTCLLLLSAPRASLHTPAVERHLTALQLSIGVVHLRGWLQGLLQRAPEELAPGEDFSQMLCFSDEALQEATAAARQRAGASKVGGQGAGSAAVAGAGSLSGAAFGVEGVKEWCRQQQAVVLVNNGLFVAFPPDSGTAAGPAAARPVTAVMAA